MSGSSSSIFNQQWQIGNASVYPIGRPTDTLPTLEWDNHPTTLENNMAGPNLREVPYYNQIPLGQVVQSSTTQIPMSDLFASRPIDLNLNGETDFDIRPDIVYEVNKNLLLPPPQSSFVKTNTEWENEFFNVNEDGLRTDLPPVQPVQIIPRVEKPPQPLQPSPPQEVETPVVMKKEPSNRDDKQTREQTIAIQEKLLGEAKKQLKKVSPKERVAPKDELKEEVVMRKQTQKVLKLPDIKSAELTDFIPSDFSKLKVDELVLLHKRNNIKGYSTMKKEELISSLIDKQKEDLQAMKPSRVSKSKKKD